MMRTIKKAQAKHAVAWLLVALAMFGVIASLIDGVPRGYPIALSLAAGWLNASARVNLLEAALMVEAPPRTV